LRSATRVVLAVLAACAAHAVTAPPADAAGYATDDQGRLYRVFPGRKKVELLGIVRVPVQRDGKTVLRTPTLTDIALHDEHGLFGISYTDLYKIELRDPSKSKHVGSLAGSPVGSFNALEFDDEGTLWAAGGRAFYRVDRKTGRASKAGSFGAEGISSGDLAWADGTLYATLDGATGCVLVEVGRETGNVTRIGPIRSEARRAVINVWGLIWDGRTLWGLTPNGDVAAIDRETAIWKKPFRVEVRFWGACPRVRM
jgi:hypothetical protein